MIPRAASASALALAFALASCDRSSKPTRPSIASALGGAHVDLDLPEAKSSEPEPAYASTYVLVSRSRISVLGDPWPIANIPVDPARGLLADDKRDGRGSFTITNLADAMQWERKAVRERDAKNPESADPHDPVVVIVADVKTTYRVLVEVAASVTDPFAGLPVFAVRTGDRARPLGIVKLGVRASDRRGSERFEVRFGERGVTISSARRSVDAGCKEAGKGPAVAREPNRPFDFGALEACLKEIRKAAPDAGGHGVYLGAEASTDFGTLMKLFDALRAAGFEAPELLAPVVPSARSGAP